MPVLARQDTVLLLLPDCQAVKIKLETWTPELSVTVPISSSEAGRAMGSWEHGPN